MNIRESDHQVNVADQDELIGLVYEAVLEPALWPQLLVQMNHYMNAIDDASLDSNDGLMVVKRDDHHVLESHFRRAVKIQHKVSQLESMTQALAHVLNRLPIGVMLVRRDATVIVCNQLASDVINTSQSLSMQHGQILAKNMVRTRQLHALIRNSFSRDVSAKDHDQANAMHIGEAGQETLVWVTAAASMRSDLQSGLLQSHLQPDLQSDLQHGEALAAVFMHSAKMQREIPLAAFIAKFQISPAESRVVKTMLNGSHTLNDAAEQLEISKHTARAQMKSIFSKTGCNSQVELMKKILINPAAMITDQIQEQGAEVKHKLLRTDQFKHAYLSMVLYDGRKLVWKEFGLPDGKPVMVFHSLTGAHPDYHAAKGLGLRLIVPERPGAHGSDPLHGRMICDWADDVSQLADHLGIDQFSLLGYSAGTPYVLACVNKIPQRIRNVALVSCMAPLRSEDDLKGMLPLNYTAMRLAYKSPELLVDFMKVFLKEIEHNPDSYFSYIADDQPDTDKKVLHEKETKALFMQAFQAAAKENFQQLCDEVILCATDWPVDFSSYKGQVSIWHGENDPLVPIAMGKRIAAMVVEPKLHYLAKEGNYLAYSHWNEILLEIEPEFTENVSE